MVGHAGAGGLPRIIGNSRKKLKKWAEDVGVPRDNIFRSGGARQVEHIVAAENAWALPGEVYLSVVDGHTTALGALGGVAVALSYGAARIPREGNHLDGSPRRWLRSLCAGRRNLAYLPGDVYEYVLGQIGPSWNTRAGHCMDRGLCG